MSHDDRKQLGFTLVELMLAMGFVAALLIAITVTVIQIADTYNKGITMKQVNQAGRAISDELQRSISSSASFDVSLSTTFVDETGKGGRLCIGKYSYVWNYGANIGTSAAYKYNGSGPEIRFSKIPDLSNYYCTTNPSGKYPNVPSDKSTELLNIGDRNLVIHSFNISSNAKDDNTKQTLYSIEFSIGTKDQVILDPVGSNWRCKAPGDLGTSIRDTSYCAVNLFSLVARTGNNSK